MEIDVKEIEQRMAVFGPIIRTIGMKAKIDSGTREQLRLSPIDVLRQHGAPVDSLPLSVREELRNLPQAFDFDDLPDTAGAMSCTACEWTVGLAFVAVGGVALITAAILGVAGCVAALIAAVHPLGIVISAQILIGILAAIATLASGIALLTILAKKICEWAGDCTPADPIDPALNQWVGQNVLSTPGNGALTTTFPVGQCVFNDVLYLIFTPPASGSATTYYMTTFATSADLAEWTNGQAISGSNPINQPSLVAGNFNNEDEMMYLIYFAQGSAGGGAALCCDTYDQSTSTWVPCSVSPPSEITSDSGLVTAAFGYLGPSSGPYLIICYVNKDEISFAYFDGASWSSPVGLGAKTKVAPALVGMRGLPVLLWADSEKHGIMYITRTGNEWTKPESAHHLATTVGITAAVLPNTQTAPEKLYMIFRSHHHSYLYWTTWDGTNWAKGILKEPDINKKDRPDPQKVTTAVTPSLVSNQDNGELFLAYVADDGTSQIHVSAN